MQFNLDSFHFSFKAGTRTLILYVTLYRWIQNTSNKAITLNHKKITDPY